MTEQPRTVTPLSVSAVVALVLGIAALVLIAVASALHPFALILAVAAILVGAVSSINARRTGRGGAWLGWVAVAVGVVAVVWLTIAAMS